MFNPDSVSDKNSPRLRLQSPCLKLVLKPIYGACGNENVLEIIFIVSILAGLHWNLYTEFISIFSNKSNVENIFFGNMRKLFFNANFLHLNPRNMTKINENSLIITRFVQDFPVDLYHLKAVEKMIPLKVSDYSSIQNAHIYSIFD